MAAYKNTGCTGPSGAAYNVAGKKIDERIRTQN
jgi:hypothetical protein